MNESLVSVCVPTYNGERYIQEALQSIKNQSYKNIEVIISDDDSQDNSLQIVQEFKKKVGFPVHIFNHEPSGIGANWNNCIRNANGNFIKFLFQDDVLGPACIEVQIRAIMNHSNIGLVACKRKFLVQGEVDSVIEKWIENYEDLQRNLDLPEGEVSIVTKDLFKTNKFLKSPLNKIGEPTTVLFKKSVVKEVGFFREDLEQILDYEFYYRLLKKYDIAILNQELVNFRIHPLQATNINRNQSIKDYELYKKILFKDFFWYLNILEKKKLFYRFNKVGRVIQRIENAARRKI